jgi:multidrug resistance efflux pump
MANGIGRIPVPVKNRWRRFRYSTLPVLGLLSLLASTFWLWNRAGEIPHAYGQVEVVRVDVATALSGILAQLPRGPWTLFDTVEPEQIVAQLDERPLRAEMTVLQEELVRLQKELAAVADKLAVSEADRARRYLGETARLLADSIRLRVELQQRRLAVLERQVLVEIDRLEAQRTNTYLECLKPLYEKKMVSEQELNNARSYRDEAAKRLAENLKVLAEAQAQQRDAEGRLDGFPKIAAFLAADIDKELAPIAAAAEVQRGRIAALEVEIGRLAIRAPLRGVITAIHHWPGENVRAGDPIVTLTAPQGRYIVSYLRQEQHIVPQVGMPVDVRMRAVVARPVPSLVERVGPQIEAIPPHMCRDPKIPEWGLPVRIALPEPFSGRPGELFEVTFKTHAANAN